MQDLGKKVMEAIRKVEERLWRMVSFPSMRRYFEGYRKVLQGAMAAAQGGEFSTLYLFICFSLISIYLYTIARLVT